MLTQTDLNLLQRVVKILREEAATLFRSSSPWTDTPESKRLKATYDRLCREERDLVALRARLSKMLADQVKPAAGAGDGSRG